MFTILVKEMITLGIDHPEAYKPYHFFFLFLRLLSFTASSTRGVLSFLTSGIPKHRICSFDLYE